MKSHNLLRFIGGLVKHPSQFRGRIRELRRIFFAPGMSTNVPMDDRVHVDLVPVQSDKALQERLVSMYVDNPSPYVFGPSTNEILQEHLERGIRYFLVTNSDGEYVGARAFNPNTKLFLSTLTDFRHRGYGYQVSASFELMMMLADEGIIEVRSNVLSSNTRMQRAMIARGWKMSPDADNPELIRGVMNLQELKARQRTV